MTSRNVSAAVFAGGQSSRFGRDKALVPVPGGSMPMLEAVVRRLQAIASDVAIIAPEDRSYSQFGVPVVRERSPGVGPLGALEAALRRAAFDRCIVVACDMPYLNQDLLEWMAWLDGAQDAVVPMVSQADEKARIGRIARPQPLHAVYRRSCLDAVQSLLVSGERRLRRVLEVVDVRYVPEAEIRAFDPDLRSFVNLNTVEEWLAIQNNQR